MRERATASIPGSILVAGGLTVAVVLLLLMHGDIGRPIVMIATVCALAGYITAFHPAVVLFAFPVVLGTAPFMHVPFTDIPLLLALSATLWVAVCFVPEIDVRLGLPEAIVAGLAAIALCSVVATGLTPRAGVEWIAWVAATAVVIPIRHLPAALRTRMCQVFAVSAAVGATLAH